MITFFRRIRQSLLSQNRLTQYLLYALGEIVLVVIGILLALQINNWNEERKESKAINNVLDEIREDLLQDQVEFMRAIALRKDDLDAQKRIIEVLETKGDWARISQNYNGEGEVSAGDVALWVYAIHLSTDPPAATRAESITTLISKE